MKKKKIISRKKDIDEHLKDYLKTSYAQRLFWLEKAHQWVGVLVKEGHLKLGK